MDELSLVVAPVVAGADSKDLFFKGSMSGYELMKVTVLEAGTVWMQYKRKYIMC